MHLLIMEHHLTAEIQQLVAVQAPERVIQSTETKWKGGIIALNKGNRIASNMALVSMQLQF